MSEPACTCSEPIPGAHSIDCAIMVALDAEIRQHDPAIQAYERECGALGVAEVSPLQRRAFKAGLRAGLELAAKVCDEHAAFWAQPPIRSCDDERRLQCGENARAIRAMEPGKG